MHLAALLPQDLCVSTYFVGGVGVVGGVPPAKEKALMARTKTVRLKATSNVPLASRWLAVGYDSHSADE
jgi:hypothetical protein